ncbi:MAG: twin-arginine translocase TatA/TatE family subunit [Flavobacteriia bacterium]|nr:twin-arginine translocase TatA/TatE family subunit [Flavobacteriia bacterium]
MLLFLSDIAGSEILLILVFVLMFFGSKSIPGIARTIGKTLRQVRDASDELKHEIKKSGMDIKKDFDLQNTINQQVESLQRPLDQMAVDIEESVQSQKLNNTFLKENKNSDDIQKTLDENS